MGLLIFIVVLMSVFAGILIVMDEINLGKYKMKSNSSIMQDESIKAFKEEYPEKDIEDLKSEIETISDMLLDNRESNRYTGRIQEKAKNDSRLDNIRKEIAHSVEILRYKKGKMMAQVDYHLNNSEYTLIMNMVIVNRGRAFLKSYRVMKRNLLNEEF